MSDLEKDGILLALKKGLRSGLNGKQSRWLHDHIKQLEERNNELIAANNKLKSACQLGIDMFVANDINVPNTIETMQDAIDESPQQSLAAHDAEVIAKFVCKLVELGVIESIEKEATGDSYLCVGGILRFANEYAQCVKDGE